MDRAERNRLDRIYDLRFWQQMPSEAKHLLYRFETALGQTDKPFVAWLRHKQQWQTLYRQQGSALTIEQMGDFLPDARWIQDGDPRFDLELAEYEQAVSQSRYHGNGHETNALLLLALARKYFQAA